MKVDSEIKGRSAGSKGGLHNLGNILESVNKERGRERREEEKREEKRR